jgi:MFS family permease
MSISRRRRLGLVLAFISASAFIVAQIFYSHARVVGSGSSDNVFWTDVEVDNDLGWRFFLPVIMCGAVGLLCFVWPTRKPPKLPESD